MKRTARSLKMELKKLILEQYNLPSLECQRWGRTKGATRTDILRGMLWGVFSKYIKHRDKGKCISCGQIKTYEELNAGHYAPVGGTSVDLWFNEFNVNGECERCNAWDEFHLIPMRINLIEKWGRKIVVDIEEKKSRGLSSKWEESKYVELIKYYLKLLEYYEK